MLMVLEMRQPNHEDQSLHAIKEQARIEGVQSELQK